LGERTGEVPSLVSKTKGAHWAWRAVLPLTRHFLLDWMYVDSATEFKRRTISG